MAKNPNILGMVIEHKDFSHTAFWCADCEDPQVANKPDVKYVWKDAVRYTDLCCNCCKRVFEKTVGRGK